MLESEVEKYLAKKIKNIKGLCLKMTSPGTRGVPDRIVLFEGRTHFIELKRPGEKPRPDQLAMHRKFKKVGTDVLIIDSKQQVDKFIERITRFEM